MIDPKIGRSHPGVYAIRCIINNKMYIGSGNEISRRFTSHRAKLNKNKHSNKDLQYDFNKYGPDAFEYLVIEPWERGTISNILREREVYFCKKFNTFLEGYNRKDPVTNKEVVPSTQGKTPRRFTHKLKEHIESLKKPVICINKTNNIKEKEFASISECAEFLNTDSKMINSVIKYWKNKDNPRYVGGRSKRRSFHGFIIVFKEDYDENYNYPQYVKPRKEIIKKPKERKLRIYKYKPIILVNKETGDEEEFLIATDAIRKYKLVPSKVNFCLNNSMRRTHHGFYFRYKLPGDHIEEVLK